MYTILYIVVFVRYPVPGYTYVTGVDIVTTLKDFSFM